MRLIRRACIAAAITILCCGAGLGGAFPGGSAGVALAGEEKPKKSVDQGDVYVGDAKKWEKPAEVDADKVYAKIDEYKEILNNGLKPGDAKYEILIGKASKRFCAAVKKAAKDGGYDLVAKLGSVKGVDAVANLTADAIADL